MQIRQIIQLFKNRISSQCKDPLRTLAAVIAFIIVSGILLCPCSIVFAQSERRELITWGIWRREGLQAAFRLFEKEHSQWQVVTSSGAGAGRMDPQKLLCGIAGGSPPDTLIQDRFAVGEWAVRDAFLPLDDFIRQSLKEEEIARKVRDAIAADNIQLAQQEIASLIAMLKKRGPSRQLSIAENLAAVIRESSQIGQTQLGVRRLDAAFPRSGLTERANELVSLCQGIHPERFYETCWEEACYGQGANRRVYAIPNTTDVRALYYNEDLLERAGGICVDANGKAKPPKDWGELKAYALHLTEYDSKGNMTRLGFAPNYGNSWFYMYSWLNGGEFMSADGQTCTLLNPRSEEALRYMVDIYDALGGIERIEAFQSTFQGNELDPFLTGKVAMKIDSNWFQNVIANYAPGLRFGVAAAPAPKGKPPITWSGGFSWAIPRGAKNPEAAFELIRFLMTDRIWMLQNVVEVKYWASRGRSFVPEMAPMAHINDMVDQTFVRNDPNLPPRIRRNFSFFNTLMPISRFRPVTPVGQLLWDEHTRAFDKAVRHTYTPAQALRRGQRIVQDELDRVFEKKVYPKMNWAYPIIGLSIVALVGLAGILFFGSRAQSVQQSGPIGHVGSIRPIGLIKSLLKPESRAGYLFASPWIIGFTVLTAGPIIASVIYSFCNYDVLHPAEFVGLENYRRLFTDDPLFWKSLANTAYMILGIPIGMAAGLAVAMLLNTKVRGMPLYRTIYYLPAIVPVVASSILWIWVLNPEMGLVNSFLRLLGWDDPPRWLQSSSWVFGSKTAIILMGLWSAGSGMIIWLAGLMGIPQHLYEAASIDGASPWQQFLHVTMPMLTPYIFFNLIMGIIGVFQIFTQAYIMTAGGPDDSTLFYVYHLFNNAFRYFKMGYASAMAWILFVIVLILTLIQMKLAPRWVHYEGGDR